MFFYFTVVSGGEHSIDLYLVLMKAQSLPQGDRLALVTVGGLSIRLSALGRTVVLTSKADMPMGDAIKRSSQFPNKPSPVHRSENMLQHEGAGRVYTEIFNALVMMNMQFLR